MSPLHRETWGLVRDLVPVVAVALVVCHVIRSHLLEWYLVPSSSMEPTLHGDPRCGDLVLVDKTAFWWARPAPFDLVVLRNRAGAGHSHLVKRVVAFGDDVENLVWIADGDVFVGSTSADLRRCVKDPLAARAMRLPNFVFPEVGRAMVTDYFRPAAGWRTVRSGVPAIVLDPAAASLAELTRMLRAEEFAARRGAGDLFLPGHLSTAVPVNTTFLGSDGEPRGSCELYQDIGVELEIVPQPGCTGLQLVFEYYDRYYAFGYAVNGTAQLSVMGQVLEIETGIGPPLTGGPLALAFGYLDGRFFFEVAGRMLVLQEIPLPMDAREPPGENPAGENPAGLGNHNLLHLAVAGGAVQIPRLRVFHDVYYRALGGVHGGPPRPFELAPGTMFLLGDNTFDSKDSRMGCAYRVEDLVGRPIGVVGPVARSHWLIP